MVENQTISSTLLQNCLKQDFLLSIEACCGICSIAIGIYEELQQGNRSLKILYQRIEYTPNKQVESLLLMITEALKTLNIWFQSLKRIIVTVGPGSFTGIRIGLAATKGIEIAMKALGLEVEIFALSSLASMAMHIVKTSLNSKYFIVAIDAGKGEAYTQIFTRYISSQEKKNNNIGDNIDSHLNYSLVPISEISLINLNTLGLKLQTCSNQLLPFSLLTLSSNKLNLTNLQDLKERLYGDHIEAYFFSYGENHNQKQDKALAFPNAAASLQYWCEIQPNSLALEPLYVRAAVIG